MRGDPACTIAHSLHQGRLDYAGLIAELQRINRDYQGDEGFRRSFNREDFYTWYSSRNMKYLDRYEVHLRKRTAMYLCELSTREKILTSAYEVEHIWAQHPSTELSEDEKESHSQNVHRLGNLTIASAKWNHG